MQRFACLIVVVCCSRHVPDATPVDGTLASDGSVIGSDAAGDACSACGIGRIVLFGGNNGNAKLGDTWSFDGTSWTPLVATGPTAGDVAMATLGDRVVAFDAAGETWIFDGTAWTHVPGTGPSARSQASLATLGNDVVLFGGTTNGNDALDDTWIFDGTTWTASAAMGPPARSSGAMASFGASVVLHAGRASGGTSLGDTWGFDGTAWTKLASGADAFFPSMAALGSTLVMYRGPNNAADPQTTWDVRRHRVDAGRWRRARRPLRRISRDPRRSRRLVRRLRREQHARRHLDVRWREVVAGHRHRAERACRPGHGLDALGARVAEPAHVDLDLLAANRARRLRGGDADLDRREALHASATGAHEVRVRHRVVLVADERESPHVVTDVGTSYELRVDEIRQVAIERRRFAAEIGERVHHVGVRDRLSGAMQELEHRDARRRGS